MAEIIMETIPLLAIPDREIPYLVAAALIVIATIVYLIVDSRPSKDVLTSKRKYDPTLDDILYDRNPDNDGRYISEAEISANTEYMLKKHGELFIMKSTLV
jgi:hypothetical protein